ncbi:MAG: Ku protein [Gemmatimonadaceae bacterium]
MASIWKGSLTFGLVAVPVELKSAVRDDHISFRMLHQSDLAPIKYERVCSADGDTVPWSDIVKGYEYTKGKYVVLTEEDFKDAAIESSKALDIMDFVKEEEIDPRYFDTPYYLVPVKGGEKAYALLREAIRTTGMVGIGKIIVRQKQHLAGVKAIGEAIVLAMMRFAHELVDGSEYTFPSSEGLRPQESRMAEQLVSSLAEKFDPSKYKDDYEENLMRIIQAKMKGKKISFEEPEVPEPTKVIDLMARLQESLDMGKKMKRASSGGSARSSSKADSDEEAPARETAARKRRTKSA